jgi:FtsP/CotA-like multicopper oxidase with cupredoxin domain
MYGALIIDPAVPVAAPVYALEYTIQLQEWLEREGYTYPAMLMEGGLPNFFTINGKAYPATDTIEMKVGQKVLLRFIGSSNNFIHPMHVHGGPFTIVATDGNPVPEAAQLEKDTVNVGPGERYDVIWTAREPGQWLIHCHIPHHMTNNNIEEQGGGGLMMIVNVQP